MVLLALNAGDETNRQRTAEQGKEINHARGREFLLKGTASSPDHT